MSFNLSAWAAKSLQKLEGTLDEAFGFDESKTSNDKANSLNRVIAVKSSSEQNHIQATTHTENHIVNLQSRHSSQASRLLSADSSRSEFAEKQISNSQDNQEANQDKDQERHVKVDDVQTRSDQPSELPHPLCMSQKESTSPAANEVTRLKHQNSIPTSQEVLSAATTSETFPPVASANSSTSDVLAIAPDSVVSEQNTFQDPNLSGQQSEQNIVETFSAFASAKSSSKANSCDSRFNLSSHSQAKQPKDTTNSEASDHSENPIQENPDRTSNLNENEMDRENVEMSHPLQAPLPNKEERSISSSNDLIARYRKVALTLRRREAEMKRLSSALDTARRDHERLCSELSSCKQSLNVSREELEKVKKERNLLFQAHEDYAAAQTLLAAKNDQIAAVLSEGEKLSVKQAKMEATIRNVRKELKEKNAEIERLEGLLSFHKKTAEEARQKNVQSGENDRARVQKLASLTVKNESLEKELLRVSSELKKETAKLSNVSETTSRLEAKIQAQEQEMLRLRKESESVRAQWNREADANKKQLEAFRSGEERESVLRRSVVRLREEMQQLENEKTESIRSLSHQLLSSRKQLLEAETKAEQLASAIPEATSPLLQQIASLQQSLKLRNDTWNEKERSLVARCNAAEVEQLRLHDCLASAQNENSELSRRVEEQNSKISEITAEYSEQSSHVKVLEEKALLLEHHRKQAEKFQLHAEQARLHNVELESRIEEMQKQFDSEKKRLIQDLEAQREGARLLQQQMEEMRLTQKHARARSCVDVESDLQSTRTESIRTMNEPVRHSSISSFGSQDNEFSATLNTNWPSTSESFGQNVHLQSSIRRKQGEIQQLKCRLSELEDERGALSDELVALKSEQAKWGLSSRKLSTLEQQMQELRRRHDTALDLIGRLREENEELKADLVDVKTVYRSQISEVMHQMEELRASSSST